MTSTNITFTLNNGNVYTQQSNGYCFAVINGKKTRCSAASYKMAHDQFIKEENERQNAANEFTNIDPVVVVENREVTGSDLQVPAVLNEHGCVDCSKCNAQNCPHRDCFRRNPTNIGGIAKCPRLKVKAEEPKVETPKVKKTRKSKDIAYTYSENGETVVTLTAKQVDFIKHLPDTCFWENGLESCIWVDCLCDDIGGQFAGKPMTVGAMISTLCEKGLGLRGKQKVNGKKCTSFELTDLGMKVFAGAEWGLE